MAFEFFSKNGEILPIDKANIPLSNIAYQYGFGVYENIKVRNGIVYFVQQHAERLLQSAEIIGLEHGLEREQVIIYTKNLLSVISNEMRDPLMYRQQQGDPHVANAPQDDNAVKNFSCNLKILLIGGKTASDAQLFILPLAPLFPDRKLYTEGVKTITVQYERLFPNAKTLNMLGSFLAYQKAKKTGCYDALLIDHHGNVLEGTRTNFFALKGKTLFTPEKKYVLEGVTRQTVLHVAKKNGFVIEEWDIALSQIKENEYDGAFLTSTSSKIVPIRQIDEFTYKEIPEELKTLMKLYDGFLEESGGILRD